MAKKILVVYYSKTGITERVGKDIAARVQADVEAIVDQTDRRGFFGFLFGGRDALRQRMTEIAAVTRDPSAYDVVVIGTPVWAWGMTPAVRAYIEQMKGKCRSIAFFATSGGSAPDKTIQAMETLAGKKAAATIGFTPPELRHKQTYVAKLEAFAADLQK